MKKDIKKLRSSFKSAEKLLEQKKLKKAVALLRKVARFKREIGFVTEARKALASIEENARRQIEEAKKLFAEGKKDEGDKITAHGHQAVGAEIADRILRRLQMVSERLERIVWAVRHHTFHLSWNLTAPEQASRRHRRFVADTRFPLLLELLRVDSVASVGHPRGMEAYELYSRLRQSVLASLDGRV